MSPRIIVHINMSRSHLSFRRYSQTKPYITPPVCIDYLIISSVKMNC